jgi:hypothetical protein
MKLHYILFLLYLHNSIYLRAEFFIHDNMVKTDSGSFLKLPETFQNERFNVTYLPQQIITIHHAPKKIRCPLAKKTSYIKCKLESSKPYQEIELLIKKESLGAMKPLLNQAAHSTPFLNNKVVRIYRKNKDNPTWTPIATFPENDALTVFAHAMVHFDGTIHF